jgi:hypothetical protein
MNNTIEQIAARLAEPHTGPTERHAVEKLIDQFCAEGPDGPSDETAALMVQALMECFREELT